MSKKSLLRTIGELWEESESLCALIPFERVFTGRIPQTELVRLPYVSIISATGGKTTRSDKARYSHGPVSFHIWLDDSALEYGHRVAEAIADVYADRCWSLGDGDKVIDVLDEGEPLSRQTVLPNVKIWEVVKLFTVCIERARADHSDECCAEDLSSPSESPSSMSSSSSSSD